MKEKENILCNAIKGLFLGGIVMSFVALDYIINKQLVVRWKKVTNSK